MGYFDVSRKDMVLFTPWNKSFIHQAVSPVPSLGMNVTIFAFRKCAENQYNLGNIPPS